MLPRERVIQVIRRGRPDRIPLYGWVSANLRDQITAAWGSVAAFEDHYQFDYAHLFGGPGCLPWTDLHKLRAQKGDAALEPADVLPLAWPDPNDSAAYAGLVADIRHHKHERGRFVYVQTPGIFEALNGAFGIENHLAYLLLFPDELMQIYRRQAEWNRAFAMNCLDLGVDMIHVSDDWGGQTSLLFSPRIWREMIFPCHKITTDAVLRRGAFLSLHSDGNVSAVLDGIVELGYQVVHPYQESAGMSHRLYLDQYADRFVLMGGLDVQTTIGFGKPDFLTAEIRRVMQTFAGGRLLFCTSHFVQDHCTMEELKLAFDTAFELSRTVCATA
jgi:uroporphyrinogen decarboxylase